MKIPLTLTAHLLPMQKPMAVRMKGKEKEKTKHQHGKEEYPHNQMASHQKAMEVTVRCLRTTTTLMVPKVRCDSLEGLRTATCTANPSQGKFSDAGRKANRNGLLSPDGNFVVKRPDILEGLFEKSFCSTKQVTLFLSS